MRIRGSRASSPVATAGSITAAAELASDVDIVVTNVGSLIRGTALTRPLSDARTMVTRPPSALAF